MADIVLRPLRYPADYENVLELWRQAGEGINVGPSDQPAEIEKKLQRDPDLFLVAECAGRIVGSVIGGFDGRRGLVYHLAVEAAYRQQGLGNRLLDEIEARLRAKGCRKAYMMVKHGNDSAMRFYEKRGWGEMESIHLFGKTLKEQ